jgi:phenylalanyl-tRNA synthetase alpha chain
MKSAALTELDTLKAEFAISLTAAEAASDDAELQRLRSSFFGPKGKVTLLLRSVGQLPAEERPVAGKVINQVRQELEGQLVLVLSRHEELARKAALSSHRLDTTLPGRQPVPMGAVHPVHRVVARMTELFVRMGFEVATGPEVELDELNFGALNFPDDHPARDMQDTFFVRAPDERSFGRLLLRTHTSPVQVRQMRAEGAPIRIIAPGRVYRCDSDASHSPMFHQIEGLWVEEGVSFAHLKGVLTSFIHSFFGERGVRFRPSFFPFVEPGAEVDIGCVFCGGKGCRVCKHTGWMEILGAGMVHPNVLEACGIDAEKNTGFAFGVGVDRIAMQLYGIDDLKHLFTSDVRFLESL